MLGQLAAGTVVAGYEIERAVGRGGMGEVYLARKRGENRRVALKLLSPGLSADERFQARFERESQLAMSLEHPNIIPVYATDEVDGVRYIAMRYVDGPTLRELIDDESPLDLRRVFSLLDQVASALDNAHEIGLVHRDIKPANVLVSRGGASEFREHAYLTDFGVSKYTGSESGFTRTGQFVGTSLYAAPEQIRGEPITGAVDVYALGCVLFEALTAQPPFARESEAALLWAHMTDEPPAVTAFRPDLPPALDAVLAGALGKTSDERYDTCGELMRAARAASGVRHGDTGRDGGAAGATVVRPKQRPKVEEAPPAPATALKPRPVAVPLAVSEADGAEASATLEPKVDVPSFDVPSVDGDVAPEPVVSDGDGVPEIESAAVLVAATTLKERVEPKPATDGAEPAAMPVGVGTVLKPSPVSQGAPATVVVDRAATTTSRAPRWLRHPAVLAGGGVVAVGCALVLVLALTRSDGESTTPTVPRTPGASTAAPVNTERPTVSDVRRSGGRVVAAPGDWQNGTDRLAYQWTRCDERGGGCRPVQGASLRSYTLTGRDVGSRLRVEVSATNAGGTRSSTSNPTRTILPELVAATSSTPPAIRGTTREGETLNVRRGAWRGTTPLRYSYAWLRCNASGSSCASIPGATRTTYTLGSRDVGDTLRVQERVRNAAGLTTVRSKPTAVVAAKPASNEGGGPSDDPTPPDTTPRDPTPPTPRPCPPNCPTPP